MTPEDLGFFPAEGSMGGLFPVGDYAQQHVNVQRNLAAAREIMALYHAKTLVLPNSCLEPWELLPMLRMAAGTYPYPGCFVEVGVYCGGSAYHLTQIARMQDRQIYLYDTFEGVQAPESMDVLPTGLLKADFATVRQTVGPYPHLYKCVFPHEVDLPPERVAFAHIDVDQYRATRESTEALLPLMAVGGVMWFDDTNALEGARQAVRELFPGGTSIDPVTGRWFVRF